MAVREEAELLSRINVVDERRHRVGIVRLRDLAFSKRDTPIRDLLNPDLMARVLTSTLIGAGLPIAAKKMNLDPAVVASPAITTLVDVTGSVIYFGLAGWLFV